MPPDLVCLVCVFVLLKYCVWNEFLKMSAVGCFPLALPPSSGGSIAGPKDFQWLYFMRFYWEPLPEGRLVVAQTHDLFVEVANARFQYPRHPPCCSHEFGGPSSILTDKKVSKNADLRDSKICIQFLSILDLNGAMVQWCNACRQGTMTFRGRHSFRRKILSFCLLILPSLPFQTEEAP